MVESKIYEKLYMLQLENMSIVLINKKNSTNGYGKWLQTCSAIER